ncbi:MAG: tRNA preQ1(34) S-adenosylmethionine ribosyltransferase-isomerase QueA [Legionellaceae bacterium]|nr:tRNA preQ1(34) S-adenosylmethionine ribosyltransferase-isomerase QueA [Legionellaceae bacterium]
MNLYNFEVPADRIAKYPTPERTASRLLMHSRSTGQLSHQHFYDLPNLLSPGDLVVMNNSRVIPARFWGTKPTGGRVQLLVERIEDSHHFLTHLKASKAPAPQSRIHLEGLPSIQLLEKIGSFYRCYSEIPVLQLLEAIGHIPLPPYIVRASEDFDTIRYQTVFAKHDGSVAAPTAGLHFDEALLQKLQEREIRTAYLTLHVGAGTFQPLRTDDLDAHVMHHEYMDVDEALCETILETRARGGRVIAVGTTTMRSLETAALSGTLQAHQGNTNIFIRPGFPFKVCDGLITNFHLPGTTLLLLVAAFIGEEATMRLYEEALSSGYRFYSYGDASLLL